MPPAELLECGYQELRRYGVAVHRGTVGTVQQAQEGFRVGLSGAGSVRARRILFSTGATDRLPDVRGLQERWGKDVLHCPSCHGWEVRDEPLGVLDSGAGDISKPLTVRQWSQDVTFFVPDTGVLSRRDREVLRSNGIRLGHEPVAALTVENDRLTGIRLEGGGTVAVSAVFVSPEVFANDRLLRDLGARVESQPLGRSVSVDECGQTSVSGAYAAGDVTDLAASVITSAAAGSRAGEAINADLILADAHSAVGTRST